MLYLKPKKYYSVLCVYEMTYNIQKKKCIFVIKFIDGLRGFLPHFSGFRDQGSGFWIKSFSR